MNHVFVSWSGGKDSCLALYRAKADGLKISYLLNMITEDGKRSWTHGQSAQLLQLQAKAIGISLIQKRTATGNYEATFKEALLALKQEGVTGGVFGDIDIEEHIEEHREWVKRVCHEVDVIPYQPLWGREQEEILKEFIDSGFEAVVVAAKADLLGEEWLGHKVDMDFLCQLNQLSIQPCGESGEYHTIVIDGPLFNQRLEILEANKVLREGHWFLEITKCDLKAK